MYFAKGGNLSAAWSANLRLANHFQFLTDHVEVVNDAADATLLRQTVMQPDAKSHFKIIASIFEMFIQEFELFRMFYVCTNLRNVSPVLNFEKSCRKVCQLKQL